MVHFLSITIIVIECSQFGDNDEETANIDGTGIVQLGVFECLSATGTTTTATNGCPVG
jgi:hypothetical protein